MTKHDVNKYEFESWLKANYQLSELTYPTIVSDSFLIFRVPLGITLDQLINNEKSFADYSRAVEQWLGSNDKKPGTRPSEYTSHIKYLVQYIKNDKMSIKQSNNLNHYLCDVDKTEFESWIRANYQLKESTYRTIMSTAFFICRENLGVTLDDLLHRRKTILDFRKEIENWLINNEKNTSSHASDYVYHLKYLLRFLGQEEIVYNRNIQNKEIKTKTTFRKNKEQKEIPIPTSDVILTYLKKWDSLDSYVIQEKALNKLFNTTYPSNQDISEVIIKIVSLNDFYSTNIYNVYAVAKHYVTLNIDKRLMTADPTLVEDLCNVPGVKSRIYSFATKYCSHHKPNDYPIYDSYVEKMLVHFKNYHQFASFEKNELRDFVKFKNTLIQFTSFFGLNKFNVKDIDKYLWQTGKEFFPNKNQKK